MRIEKINERQIRCTLNQKDLKDREIGISELAYGTAKAKALFRDMMQQASYEFGFDTDDIPLMIEAIPLLPEALIVVITKVEDPDELDTRFSNFTEERDWIEDEDDFLYEDTAPYDELDEIIAYEPQNDDLENEGIWKFSDHSTSAGLLDAPVQNFTSDGTDFISLPEALGMEPRPRENTTKKYQDIVMIFAFKNLEAVTKLASHIYSIYHGENTLYKDASTSVYYLILHRSEHEPEEFGRICNILYEYGTLVKNSGSMQYYYEEHFKPIIAKNAVHVLATL